MNLFREEREFLFEVEHDPCSEDRDTTTLCGGLRVTGEGFKWWRKHSPGSLLLRAATSSGADQAGSRAVKGPRAGGMSQNGSTALPGEAHPGECLPRAHDCRTAMETRDHKGSGSGSTPSSVPCIGEAPCGLGEARLWLRSEFPVGTKRNGERGGLMGKNHEALCGEAPKGQPMIHRRHPRHPRNGPPGQERGKERTIKAQRPSLLTKEGKNRHGGRSRDVLRGERGASGT